MFFRRLAVGLLGLALAGCTAGASNSYKTTCEQRYQTSDAKYTRLEVYRNRGNETKETLVFDRDKENRTSFGAKFPIKDGCLRIFGQNGEYGGNGAKLNIEGPYPMDIVAEEMRGKGRREDIQAVNTGKTTETPIGNMLAKAGWINHDGDQRYRGLIILDNKDNGIISGAAAVTHPQNDCYYFMLGTYPKEWGTGNLTRTIYSREADGSESAQFIFVRKPKLPNFGFFGDNDNSIAEVKLVNDPSEYYVTPDEYERSTDHWHLNSTLARKGDIRSLRTRFSACPLNLAGFDPGFNWFIGGNQYIPDLDQPKAVYTGRVGISWRSLKLMAEKTGSKEPMVIMTIGWEF